MLPSVKIIYENGALGSVAPSADGTMGLVATGTAVSGKFELTKAYILRSLESLVDLGITAEASDKNAHIYKFVREFYAEAGAGAELWLMAFAGTLKQSDLVDQTKNTARQLILEANGRLRGLAVVCNPPNNYTPTIENGLDKDVALAMLNAQKLADWATNSLFAPIFVLLEGRSYNGNPVDLADLTEFGHNRVGVLIGDTVANSKGSSMGLLAGRVATIPVQRKVARVKDGAVRALQLFIKDRLAELADVESIHNKGYITFRTFVGKAGYFFTDDNLATRIADDYRSLARRRTIDKAYRIAYLTLIEELNDEIPVMDNGELVPAMVKSWQTTVESAIANQMTSQGNLGTDPTNPQDTGVQCFIDHRQNIVATSRMEVSLKVKPYGYAKFIEVKLGFKTLNS